VNCPYTGSMRGVAVVFVTFSVAGTNNGCACVSAKSTTDPNLQHCRLDYASGKGNHALKEEK
jgi:hypothetical protein